MYLLPLHQRFLQRYVIIIIFFVCPFAKIVWVGYSDPVRYEGVKNDTKMDPPLFFKLSYQLTNQHTLNFSITEILCFFDGHKVNMHSMDTKTVVFSCHFYTKLESQRGKVSQWILTRLQHLGMNTIQGLLTKTLLFPVVRHKHWFLVVMSISACKVFFVGSA